LSHATFAADWERIGVRQRRRGLPVCLEVAGRAAVSELAFFAINLDRSPERWAEIERLFGDMPWPLHRVRAVDAREPEAVLAVRGQRMASPPNGIGQNLLRYRTFTLVEEACFASHILALKTFLASKYTYAVILEDDAVPAEGSVAGLVGALRQLASGSLAFDLVKIEGSRRSGRRLAVEIADLGRAKLVRSLRPCSGGAAYLVTRDAARRMIEKAGALTLPVDDFLSNPGLHGCDVMHLSPWLIVQSGARSTMRGMRRPHHTLVMGDPSHLVGQGLRRAGLRIALWARALKGFPASLAGLYRAPWLSPDTPRRKKHMSARSRGHSAAGNSAKV